MSNNFRDAERILREGIAHTRARSFANLRARQAGQKVRNDFTNVDALHAIQLTGRYSSYSVIDGMIEVLSKAGRDINGDLLNFAERLYREEVDVSDLKRLHSEVAVLAQQSVIERVEAIHQQTRLRREIDRNRGGLLKAVTNPGFVDADEKNIYFGNIDVMNKTANHWRRLNFGAGKAASKSKPRSFPMSFGGVRAQPIGLIADPAPAFRMPVGLFIDPTSGEPRKFNPGRRGMDDFFTDRMALASGRFYEGSRGAAGQYSLWRFRRKTAGGANAFTQGIMGRQFLDAGMKTMATALPVRYDELMEREANRAGKSRTKRIRGSVS